MSGRRGRRPLQTKDGEEMEKNNNLSFFKIYTDYIEIWKMLSDEQAGKLVKALLDYANIGKKIDSNDGMLKITFAFMAAQMDRDNGKAPTIFRDGGQSKADIIIHAPEDQAEFERLACAALRRYYYHVTVEQGQDWDKLAAKSKYNDIEIIRAED